jgi:hypothetical protein
MAAFLSKIKAPIKEMNSLRKGMARRTASNPDKDNPINVRRAKGNKVRAAKMGTPLPTKWRKVMAPNQPIRHKARDKVPAGNAVPKAGN